VVLLTSVILAACGPIAYDYSKEPDPRKGEFVLGINDAVHINVWKNPELSVDARIRPDGTITMPLVGDIKASGRAPSALKAEITKRLQSFIRDESAIVSVAVTEVNSYRFTVSGQVEHAGLMTAKYYVTASEAVAMAGGLNRYANPHRLTIVRNDNRGARRIPVDYERIASGEHPEEDLVILSGDTLFAQ
jgi:polysaccharide export outer membrane protein